jgi:hypothetical protein
MLDEHISAATRPASLVDGRQKRSGRAVRREHVTSVITAVDQVIERTRMTDA